VLEPSKQVRSVVPLHNRTSQSLSPHQAASAALTRWWQVCQCKVVPICSWAPTVSGPDLEKAWADVHENTREGWYVGRPGYEDGRTASWT
jgi:hypothetical protein